MLLPALVHSISFFSCQASAALTLRGCLTHEPCVQKYSGPVSAFQGILQTEGVSALFRGLPLTMIKQGPSQVSALALLCTQL